MLTQSFNLWPVCLSVWQAQEALLDYVNDTGTSMSYTSNIGNIIATRIASMWGFTGPAFTVTEGSNSVFRCVQLASSLLASGQVEAVVVAGVDLCGSAEALFTKIHHGDQPMSTRSHPSAPFEASHDGFFVGEGAGCLVLRRLEDVSGLSNVRVYASLDALGEGATVEQSAHQALADASVPATSVEALELTADSPAQSLRELQGLARVFHGAKTVAVGTVKANVGHCGYASGAAALIKSALALYNQYLPQLAHWSRPAPQQAALWERSAFFVCPESRAWVKNKGVSRFMGVSGAAASSQSCFLLLLADVHHETHNRISLAPSAPKLLCVRADSAAALIAAVEVSVGRAESSAHKEFMGLLKATVAVESPAALALCLVATVSSLVGELKKGLAGVVKSVQTGSPQLSLGPVETLTPSEL